MPVTTQVIHLKCCYVPELSTQGDTCEGPARKAMILEEAGRREEAVAELDKRADKIVDAVGMREQRARLHLHLGNVDKATAVYRELLAGMPDNYRYHEVGRCSLTPGWKQLTPRSLSGTFSS